MLDQNRTKSIFQHRVRIRVCGILKESNGILLLKHERIGPAGYLWSPPGGGVEFGDSLHETLIKEFEEETHLKVSVGDYLFANEYMDDAHHAIEHFFRVHRIEGTLQLGNDPELDPSEQILSDVRYFDSHALAQLPNNAIHNAFNAVNPRDKIDELRGLITFKH